MWDGGEMSVQSMGKMGKDFRPNFSHPFHERINRGSCNDGSWELFPYFTALEDFEFNFCVHFALKLPITPLPDIKTRPEYVAQVEGMTSLLNQL